MASSLFELKTEPAARSFTLCATGISSAAASAEVREAMWAASPQHSEMSVNRTVVGTQSQSGLETSLSWVYLALYRSGSLAAARSQGILLQS